MSLGAYSLKIQLEFRTENGSNNMQTNKRRYFASIIV